MIDREKLNKVLDAVESLTGVSFDVSVNKWKMSVNIWTGNFGEVVPEETRHKVLSAMTPLVGKMTKTLHPNNDIDFVGETDDLHIRLNRADVCKIMGYKIVKTEQPKMVLSEEMETVEKRISISDCDLKEGRFKLSDIEVPA